MGSANYGPIPEGYSLMGLREYKWSNDYSWHRILTCVNHQLLRWTTKNVWNRHLHFASFDYRTAEGGWAEECTCPMDDLRVIVPLGGYPLDDK